jgi:hypothetical protein
MSANASMSPEDIAAARLPDQVIFYQVRRAPDHMIATDT